MKGLGFRIEGMALRLDRSSHTLSSQVGDCEEGTNEGADNFTGAKLKKASFSNGALPPTLGRLHHPVPQDAQGCVALMGICVFCLANLLGHPDLSAQSKWSKDR